MADSLHGGAWRGMKDRCVVLTHMLLLLGKILHFSWPLKETILDFIIMHSLSI